MSAKRAIAFRPPQKPAGAFFHWLAPGVPIAVHFHLNVIDVIEGKVLRAGKKGTAGVLLGRIENGQRPTLIVEDCEPIYVPNGAESVSAFGNCDAWKAVVGRWRASPEKRISIVGFYRSASPGQKAPDRHDLDVIKANSTDSEKIFLLIEPHTERPTSGFLFMAPDGVEKWKWSEIPFNRGELLAAGNPQATVKQNPEQYNAQPHITQPQLSEIDGNSEPNPASEKKPGDPTRLQWILGTAAVVAFIFIVMITLNGGQIFHPSSSVKSVEASELGLKTHRSGTDLEVSWDRKSPQVLNATSGRLSITDGSIQKTVDLDSTELRSGSILYTPVSDDVAMQLDVVNEKLVTVATESVRIIGGSSSVVADLAIGGVPSYRNRSAQAPVSASRQKASEASRPDTSGAASDAKFGLRAEASSGDKQSKPQDVATIDKQQKQVDQQTDQQIIDAMTSPVEAKQLPSGSAPAARNASEPIEREQLAPVSTTTTTAARASTTPPLFPSASALMEKENGVIPEPPASHPLDIPAAGHNGVQPAQMIFGKQPQFPMSARQARISGTVKITFRVGSDGKVTSITNVTGPNLLTQAVIDVVKSQRYTPARLNGVPTESEVSMIYNFKLN